MIVPAEMLAAGDYIVVPHSSDSRNAPGACVGTVISAELVASSGQVCIFYSFAHGGAEYRTNSIFRQPDAPIDTLMVRVSDR